MNRWRIFGKVLDGKFNGRFSDKILCWHSWKNPQTTEEVSPKNGQFLCDAFHGLYDEMSNFERNP